MMMQRVERAWLRVSVTVILLILPLLVVYARLYRGMHHLSDVIVGVINGLVCAWLAWHYLRRSPRPADEPVASSAAAAEGAR